jgi:cullin 3
MACHGSRVRGAPSTCGAQAEQRLAEEVDRVAHYLDPATEPKIREVAERELIERHMRTIAEMEHSGVVAMIEDNKIDDLKRAYELFKRVTAPVSGLGVIRDIMAAHVKARGTQLVQDDERNSDPVQYVQGLLALRDKYEAVISSAFSGDKQFYNALNQSCESFVNLNQHSPEVRAS